MDTKTALGVLDDLEEEVKEYRVPVMDLHETHGGEPLKVLIGTILSARTKDETTAAACKRLFKKVKTIDDLDGLSQEELATIIKPVGFYKTKARNLKRLPAAIKKEGGIPETIEGLIRLPGVGRKTANLVLSIAFNKDGLCVDTHVHRITNRLGYVRTKNPLETEMRLRKKLPKNYWRKVNRILVAYGQQTCTPQSPWCSQCPVRDRCERRGVVKSR